MVAKKRKKEPAKDSLQNLEPIVLLKPKLDKGKSCTQNIREKENYPGDKR